MKKSETGKRGEDAALSWLEAQGFRLRDRNWRSGRKELDLVMESAERVHIVEVKTLTPPLRMRPGDKVDGRKQAAILSAARSYIARQQIRKEVQFDVASVVLGPDGAEVEYIPEAFYPVTRY